MAELGQELCYSLLHCESEDEVKGVLRSAGVWDDRSVWQPYGGISNNRSVVSNQQSSPVAALVEKVVNSVDAVLIGEAYRAGIDPRSGGAPTSMQAAVERFIGLPNGRIENVDAATRTRLAERIRLVACGTKDQPAYMVIDDGEGQSPDEFPNTLLSLLKENKAAIRFVQGQFNMGGTGVLQFCGANGFQLIISRRQSFAPAPQSARANEWGFTIVRRLEPSAAQPLTMYVYLAPGGRVPSFEAESVDVLPGRYPENYKGPISAGTCIKVWNYKFPGRLKTLATLDLRYALERYLQAPALPVRIHERRPGYRAHFFDTTMSGLYAVLADDKGRIEPGVDTGGPMEIADVGRAHIRVVVLKEPEDDKKAGSDRYAGGVFFNVNGQLHSELGTDFISRRTRYDYIARDMIVIVDCTELPQRVREDLFLASRDRMRQGHDRTTLEDAVVEFLRDHQGLRDLNARRRQARLTAQSEKDASAVIQALVRADPTLAQIFGKGQKIKIPTGPVREPEPYVGKDFPTFFRLAREPKSGLVKGCPINRTCRVEFETDAANDYFSRGTDPGRLDVKGAPSRVGAIHLWNGKATIRLSTPPTSNPGDHLRVNIAVSDVSRAAPFESCLTVEVEPEALPEPPGPPTPPPGSSLTGFPNIVEVFQADWVRYKFNEHSAVELKAGDDDVLDLYLNMDNLHLRNEIVRRRQLDPDVIRYWFKYGMMLLALGMLYHHRQQRLGNEDSDEIARGEGEDFAAIADACKGLAVTLIPVIAQLGQSVPEGKKAPAMS